MCGWANGPRRYTFFPEIDLFLPNHGHFFCRFFVWFFVECFGSGFFFPLKDSLAECPTGLHGLIFVLLEIAKPWHGPQSGSRQRFVAGSRAQSMSFSGQVGSTAELSFGSKPPPSDFPRGGCDAPDPPPPETRSPAVPAGASAPLPNVPFPPPPAPGAPSTPRIAGSGPPAHAAPSLLCAPRVETNRCGR